MPSKQQYGMIFISIQENLPSSTSLIRLQDPLWIQGFQLLSLHIAICNINICKQSPIWTLYHGTHQYTIRHHIHTAFTWCLWMWFHCRQILWIELVACQQLWLSRFPLVVNKPGPQSIFLIVPERTAASRWITNSKPSLLINFTYSASFSLIVVVLIIYLFFLKKEVAAVKMQKRKKEIITNSLMFSSFLLLLF